MPAINKADRGFYNWPQNVHVGVFSITEISRYLGRHPSVAKRLLDNGTIKFYTQKSERQATFYSIDITSLDAAKQELERSDLERIDRELDRLGVHPQDRKMLRYRALEKLKQKES